METPNPSFEIIVDGESYTLTPDNTTLHLYETLTQVNFIRVEHDSGTLFIFDKQDLMDRLFEMGCEHFYYENPTDDILDIYIAVEMSQADAELPGVLDG